MLFFFSRTNRGPLVNDGRKQTKGALLVNYMPQADEGQIASDEHVRRVPTLTNPHQPSPGPQNFFWPQSERCLLPSLDYSLASFLSKNPSILKGMSGN